MVGAAGRAEAIERGPGGRSGRVVAGADPAGKPAGRQHAARPPGGASRLADVAIAVAAASASRSRCSTSKAIGCRAGWGGLLGVNAGSDEPPRIVELAYRPACRIGTGLLAIVGKGVMFDAGGLAIKTTDASHGSMKGDMGGAAAVILLMSTVSGARLHDRRDGLPDVHRQHASDSAPRARRRPDMRGGTTVEIQNTDAEGRLILADDLVMAIEDRPDPIIDLATLTGVCEVASARRPPACIGQHPGLIDQIADGVGIDRRGREAVRRSPLTAPPARLRGRRRPERGQARYGGRDRRGPPRAVRRRRIPWAHLDIAGPMKVDADEGWRSKGATGFGTRLLVDLTLNFTSPTA